MADVTHHPAPAPAVTAPVKPFRVSSPLRRARDNDPLVKIVGVGLAVLAWQVYSTVSDTHLVPSIALIGQELVVLATSGDLWLHGRSTLAKAFSGLGIAVVFGVIAGMVAARSRVYGGALRSLVSIGYPIPKLALYPITVLIFGLGAASKVAQVALECFFPLFVHAYAGARGVDKHMVWLARNSGASRRRLLMDVIAPSALPSILTGLRVAAPIMLIVVTVTELIGETLGLGFLITHAAAHLIPARAFAVVVVLGMLGFILDRAIVWVRRRAVFWEKGVTL